MAKKEGEVKLHKYHTIECPWCDGLMACWDGFPEAITECKHCNKPVIVAWVKKRIEGKPWLGMVCVQDKDKYIEKLSERVNKNE